MYVNNRILTVKLHSNLFYMKDIAKNWKKNKRQIKMTIDFLNKAHVESLRREWKLNELSLDNIYSKMQLILWMSQLEVEFNLLVFENEHFTKSFIDEIDIDNLSTIEKWDVLNDYFFKAQYFGRQDRELDELNLGLTNYSRYAAIHNFINYNLKIFVEIRNKLAHGQWAVSFNRSGSGGNQQITTSIWKLSKKEIMLIKSISKNLPPLMKLLITSRKTFERDVDRYMHRLLKAQKDADVKYERLKKKKHKKD